MERKSCCFIGHRTIDDESSVFLTENKDCIARRASPKIPYYDEFKISERVKKAGKASYVERNQDMINDSDICVFFYKEEYKPELDNRYRPSGKSGTHLAYDYAKKKGKNIINIAKKT